ASITLDTNLTTIGSYAFSSCTALKSIEIPDSMTAIDNNVFQDCTSLVTVTIPDSVTSIGDSAFSGCTSLANFTFPDSVITIDSGAFYDCTSISYLVIGTGLTRINDYAFYNCTSLYDIYYADSETDWGDIVVSSDGNGYFLGATVHYNSTGPDAGDADDAGEGDTENQCTSHVAGEPVIENEIAATCTEDGSYDSVTYCTVCGEELSRETVTVPATGHNYVSEVTKEATATQDGVTTYTCTECGDTYTESIPATGTSDATSGDLNGDDEVNASDLTILARHVGKVETMEDETALANADVTGDGNVDASDLTRLAQYVGKIISSLD
ncbi:MAG: leucine-rich repeat protein, partial [Oscillospiraceae bacterium]|nr:leucine-rich repeat protein [Oscillospiraceae bacterium]